MLREEAIKSSATNTLFSSKLSPRQLLKLWSWVLAFRSMDMASTAMSVAYQGFGPAYDYFPVVETMPAFDN